jgi:hypothetical protein
VTDDLRDLVRRIERATAPRRLNRPPVNIPVVVDAGERRIEGLGRDLSEHGLRLRSRHACALHERVQVRLRPPGFGRDIAVAAEIRWVRPEGGPDEYGLGFEFVHTDESRRAVRKLLVMHAKKALPAIQRTGHTTRRRAKADKDARIPKRK